MKKNIVFIIVCVFMLLCSHFGRDYPYICILVSYFCGVIMVISHPLSKELQDYINKKLN